MKSKFQNLEVVKVRGDVVIRGKRIIAAGEVGFVGGWTDASPDGVRDFGVLFNSLGEVVVVPESYLESLGRIADPSELKTRSRTHQRRGRPKPEGEG
jgi:hypothetical protein